MHCGAPFSIRHFDVSENAWGQLLTAAAEAGAGAEAEAGAVAEGEAEAAAETGAEAAPISGMSTTASLFNNSIVSVK